MNFLQKFYSSILIIVAIFCLLFFFCLLPSLRSIIADSNKLAMKKQELISIESLSENFEDFEKNFLFYEKGLGEMEDILKQESFIDIEVPVSFINFFKEQISNLNLNLKIFSMDTNHKEGEILDFVSFRINGTGEFVNIMKFLEKIENSRWLIEEIDLSFNKQEPLRGQSSEEFSFHKNYVEINFLINVYVQS